MLKSSLHHTPDDKKGKNKGINGDSEFIEFTFSVSLGKKVTVPQ